MAAAHPTIRVLRASVEDAARVAPLFSAYLRFYRRRVQSRRAKRFLHERLRKRQAVIFLAFLGTGGGKRKPVGFVQLYPSFASLDLKPHWILNDLFVAPEARRHGVARALMERARRLANSTGANGLSLETATDNRSAQKLYEQLGYQRDRTFYRYFLKV